jgi:TPR repeat protein
VAQWKLGRMYADGDGVIQDDLRAFEYFSRIANAHAEDSPSAPQATIVANAFVALGRYYLNGIPNSKIKPDSDRAREMFSYAASYFGNADAQYDLARLYLKTPDASRDDFRYGARWLGLAAQKGQHQAQAMLGQMLFNGDRLPPQRARGLMWLTLGRDCAGTPREQCPDPRAPPADERHAQNPAVSRRRQPRSVAGAQRHDCGQGARADRP